MMSHLQKRIADVKAAKLDKCRERRYIRQLQRRGWSNMDVWGLNTHLANYMLPMFKLLFTNPSGYPCNLKSRKQWQAIGKKIIWSLERHAKDDFFDLAEAATGYRPMSKPENPALRKAWMLKTKRIYAQADEGMYLFAKYFGNFWD